MFKENIGRLERLASRKLQSKRCFRNLAMEELYEIVIYIFLKNKQILILLDKSIYEIEYEKTVIKLM